MREDCNAFISLLSPSTSDFDSCMCEDCNERIRLAGAGNAYILIHACARIATSTSGEESSSAALILIHACARIATYLCPVGVEQAQYFDSCMREDCNRGDTAHKPIFIILIHACAKIATQKDGE